MTTNGTKNRVKGHSAERYYAHIFRQLGFPFCKTAREGSRLHDNAKIDLVFIPYNIQIKAGKQRHLNAGKELLSMNGAIKSFFPPNSEVHKQPCLLLHKKEVGQGNKRTINDEIIYMSMTQFKRFLKKNPSLKFDKLKELKIDTTSEFKQIVSMTFDYFKNNVILKHII